MRHPQESFLPPLAILPGLQESWFVLHGRMQPRGGQVSVRIPYEGQERRLIRVVQVRLLVEGFGPDHLASRHGAPVVADLLDGGALREADDFLREEFAAPQDE